MKEPYFLRVTEQTPTCFWINNPTRQEAEGAIAAAPFRTSTRRIRRR